MEINSWTGDEISKKMSIFFNAVRAYVWQTLPLGNQQKS